MPQGEGQKKLEKDENICLYPLDIGLANCYIQIMRVEELRKKREKLDMTQRQLAKKLGVHWVTLARWEANRARIPQSVEIALREIERQEQR